MNIFDVDFTALLQDGSLVNELNRCIMRVDDPALIAEGLKRLGEEPHRHIEVLFAENPAGRTVIIPVTARINLFYASFDEDFNLDSQGMIFPGKTPGLQWLKTNFRYLLVFTQAKDALAASQRERLDGSLVRFLTGHESLSGKVSRKMQELNSLKQKIYGTHDRIALKMAALKERENKYAGVGEMPQPEMEEIRKLKDVIAGENKTLDQLRSAYDQHMLSRMVSNEMDEEVSAWWMNRY